MADSPTLPMAASLTVMAQLRVVGEYIRFDPDIDWTRFWENISYESPPC